MTRAATQAAVYRTLSEHLSTQQFTVTVTRSSLGISALGPHGDPIVLLPPVDYDDPALQAFLEQLEDLIANVAGFTAEEVEARLEAARWAEPPANPAREVLAAEANALAHAG